MQLFPAIDLRGGQVVRLTQGDYDRMTVYGQDPCAQARSFVAAGAKNLHVVDLDGAKDGTLSNYDTIAALAKQGGLYIEVGGGIRTEERIEKYLSLGVGRCILGSVAVTDFAFTASGGISSEAELLELQQMGTAAAILGKSLYTGALDLARCVQLVQD